MVGVGITAIAFPIATILNATDLIFGKFADDAMYEMFLSQYQAEIQLAFYDTMGDGNYLLKDYTDEEISDLQALAALYLHTGALDPVDSKVSESCKKNLEIVQTLQVPSASSLSIANYSYPGQYTNNLIHTGDKYVIFGTIQADENIKNVQVLVTDRATGTSVIDESSGMVNRSTYDLIDLDNQISIGTLPASTYTIQYIAETESEGRQILAAETFRVEQGKWSLTDYRLPRIVMRGGIFNVTGIVSGENINSAVIEIISLDGKTTYTRATANLDTTTYNLANLDDAVVFGDVTASYARYRIIINDTVIIDQPYMIR